jgi:hypothetical protein
MGQQMQMMQEENQNLRMTATNATNALANMSARRGGAVAPGATKVAEAGGGGETTSAIVDASRNMLGTPTGVELPT